MFASQLLLPLYATMFWTTGIDEMQNTGKQPLPGHTSVSVAMCTYNGSRYLKPQLSSIASQTQPPAELVVCDDGSNDSTLEIVEAFAGTVPFPVRVHRNEVNLGSTKNFEQAIQMCGSDFITLCDQDDLWQPGKLEAMTKILAESGAGGVFCNAYLIDCHSSRTGEILWSEGDLKAFEGADKKSYDFVSILLRCNVVTGATMMFRADLRDRILPCSVEWVHDGWLAWMIVLHSQLLAVPEPLMSYRIHSSQQLGLVGRSPIARLRRARSTGMEAYRAMEKQFEILLDYARSHREVCSADLCRRLDDKRRHARFRAELQSSSTLVRVMGVSRQSSAYRKYAQGWKSMLKDILL
jgi:hypothetical protein